MLTLTLVLGLVLAGRVSYLPYTVWYATHFISYPCLNFTSPGVSSSGRAYTGAQRRLLDADSNTWGWFWLDDSPIVPTQHNGHDWIAWRKYGAVNGRPKDPAEFPEYTCAVLDDLFLYDGTCNIWADYVVCQAEI